MELNKYIDFLNFQTKPKINGKNLEFVLNTKKVYVNLFEIKLNKKLILFQYPYTIDPPIGATDILVRDKLFKRSSKQLKTIYGDCFISGDSLYSMKEINEDKYIKCSLYLKEKGKKEYSIEFNNFENKRTISQEDIQRDPLSKQFIEMIIKDILHSNSKLEFYKDIFVFKNDKKIIKTNNASISFYPGFKTSFMETESGNYLNVTLKNKIIQNETIYDFINKYKYKNNKDIQNEIKKILKGHSFKATYAKRNYQIDDLLFDKTPRNTNINYEGKTIDLVEYYSYAHNLEIIDKNQPLILVRRTDSQGEPINLYFVPEFCPLSGLEDEITKDRYIMKELSYYTKLEPEKRVNKTNEFLNLFLDKERVPEHPDSLSSKEKCDLYGIEVKPTVKLFDEYYMEETKLIGRNNQEIHSNDKTFPVFKKKNMTKWLCFYEKDNFYEAENLYNTLNKASEAFGLKITEPEWVELEKSSSAKDWVDIADDYFCKKKSVYDFVVFLLGENDKIYNKLNFYFFNFNHYPKFLRR